ncbi:hypothetical protein AMJ80_06050 [bacterium SM23_31]|nr:MAG: hypothetical protein AMJ80_06050 [bacterium SM23_31]
MTQQKRLREYMQKFTENQKNAIAEMVASDCVLMEIWHEYVNKCVKDGEWKPDALLRALVDRVEEAVKDIEQTSIFTGFDNIFDISHGCAH